jgi:preprotein translocase subunit SecG
LELRWDAEKSSGQEGLLSVSVDQAVGKLGGTMARRTWITVAMLLVTLVLLAYIYFTPVSFEDTGTRRS